MRGGLGIVAVAGVWAPPIAARERKVVVPHRTAHIALEGDACPPRYDRNIHLREFGRAKALWAL